MPKNKRPVPRKFATPAEPDTDAQAQVLADLALDVVDPENEDGQGAAERELALSRQIRNALRKKHDDVLYGAIEVASYTEPEACRYLRSRIGEAAATLHTRREGAPAQEIDAFMVPVFVQSTGGLVEAEDCADEPAFEQLVASIQAHGLESADAKVVLVRHAYDLAEIDRISYTRLQDLLREAAVSLGDKKMVAAPEIERSIAGWGPRAFAAGDAAMELRFLLGFSLKRADDPFYQVPEAEAAADAYFAARMERYRRWTDSARPLVARCLAADPARLSINFLYQDLFFGAKEQGETELALLGTLSEVNAALAQHGLEPGGADAVVAPLDAGDAIMLRVNLYRPGAATPFAGAERALALDSDLGSELDDLCDALATRGLGTISVAQGFDAAGQAQQSAPWQAP